MAKRRTNRITPALVRAARAATGLTPVDIFYWALSDGRADAVLAAAYAKVQGTARGNRLAAYVRDGQVSAWKIILDTKHMTKTTSKILGLSEDYVRGFRYAYHTFKPRPWYPAVVATSGTAAWEEFHAGYADGRRVARQEL